MKQTSKAMLVYSQCHTFPPHYAEWEYSDDAVFVQMQLIHPPKYPSPNPQSGEGCSSVTAPAQASVHGSEARTANRRVGVCCVRPGR